MLRRRNRSPPCCSPFFFYIVRLGTASAIYDRALVLRVCKPFDLEAETTGNLEGACAALSSVR